MHRISKMNGMRILLTTVVFSIGEFGMISIPFTACYVSKTYLLHEAEMAGAAGLAGY